MAHKIKSQDGSPEAYMSYGGRNMLAPGTTAADINAMPVNRRSRARKAHKRAARESFSSGDTAGYLSHRKTEKALK